MFGSIRSISEHAIIVRSFNGSVSFIKMLSEASKFYTTLFFSCTDFFGYDSFVYCKLYGKAALYEIKLLKNVPYIYSATVLLQGTC